MAIFASICTEKQVGSSQETPRMGRVIALSALRVALFTRLSIPHRNQDPHHHPRLFLRRSCQSVPRTAARSRDIPLRHRGVAPPG